MNFQDALLSQVGRHLTGGRWGKAALTLAVTLLVGVAGTGATIYTNATEAHEAREIEASKQVAAQRQAICHEIFNYAEDETPNKQIDPQNQQKINNIVAAGLQNCTMVPSLETLRKSDNAPVKAAR